MTQAPIMTCPETLKAVITLRADRNRFMDAAMVIEQVLEHVVSYLGSDPAETRRLNFLKRPDEIQRNSQTGTLASRFRACHLESILRCQSPA